MFFWQHFFYLLTVHGIVKSEDPDQIAPLYLAEAFLMEEFLFEILEYLLSSEYLITGLPRSGKNI